MIVLVESNFILELALQRDEVEHVERIIAFAEEGGIQLVIPACAFAESFQALALSSKRRKQLESGLRSEIRELARSKRFADLEKTSAAVTDTLVASETSESDGLCAVIDRLIPSATLINLDAAIIKNISRTQKDQDLGSGDALILASIDTFLTSAPKAPKLFATKDRDFNTDSVHQCLGKHDCKLISQFFDAAEYIKSTLAKN